jgi:hypothetical protein
MLFSKNFLIAAALTATAAVPAMAEDFLAAGCVINPKDKFVVAIINHNSRHIKHEGHEKLQLPIGKNRDEDHPNLSPQEVALQQTEEETGVPVKLLSSDPLRVQQTPKGKVYTFACAAQEDGAFDRLVRTPVDDFIEVVLINLETNKDPSGEPFKEQWRHPEDVPFLKNLIPHK